MVSVIVNFNKQKENMRKKKEGLIDLGD